MLAELAAANAAFAVIKEAVANAGDIMAAGQKVYEYFDAKSAIQRKYAEKSKNGKSSDMEEFFALEKIKKQEEELRNMMIYQGRAGMWQDWLKFQAEARKKREAAKRAELLAAQRRKEKILEIVLVVGAASLLTVLLVVGLWLGGYVRKGNQDVVTTLYPWRAFDQRSPEAAGVLPEQI